MGMRDQSERHKIITEDVGVLEVDFCVFDGISGVQECLTLSVELDGVGGLVDAVGRLYQREVGDSLSFNPDVLLVHIFYVVDIVDWLEGLSSQDHQQQSSAEHFF